MLAAAGGHGARPGAVGMGAARAAAAAATAVPGDRLGLWVTARVVWVTATWVVQVSWMRGL